MLDGNDSVAVESSVCKFSNYGISNKESVAELFVSLLNKVGFFILRWYKMVHVPCRLLFLHIMF